MPVLAADCFATFTVCVVESVMKMSESPTFTGTKVVDAPMLVFQKIGYTLPVTTGGAGAGALGCCWAKTAPASARTSSEIRPGSIVGR